MVWSATLVLLMMVGLIENFEWCKHDCVPSFPGEPIEKHTMCIYKEGGGPQCQRYTMGLSKEEKDFILDLHNSFRANVANGKETRGVGGPQPPAANMMEMIWDDEVAMIAQRWADQCQTRGHDKCRKTMDDMDLGQNAGAMAGSGMNLLRTDMIKDRITAWYDEVAVMVPSDADSAFTSSTGVTGHYTQLVWARSTRVGCGLAHLNGRSFAIKLVCNYKPVGNFVSAPVYIRGPAASKCPQNSQPSTTYKGLCKATGNDLDIVHPNTPSTGFGTGFPPSLFDQLGRPGSGIELPMTSPLQITSPNAPPSNGQISMFDLINERYRNQNQATPGSGIQIPITPSNAPPGALPQSILIPIQVPTSPNLGPVQVPVEKKKKKDSLFWRIITLPWRFLKWLFSLPIRLFEFIKSKLFD